MTGVSVAQAPGHAKGRGRALAGNLVAAVIGLTIALAAVEGVARLVSGTLDISPYMQYDELLGWTSLPNTIKQHKNAADGFDVTYRINANGFRGTPYDRPKPQGATRIVVLGDSNGFGWGVDEGRQFAAILDDKVPGAEVINQALSGYGPDQSYLRFVKEGVHWNPDLVILQITPNDFEEIQFPFFNQKAKPQFVFDDRGNLKLVNVPAKAIGARAQAFHDDSIPLPFREWLGWHSYAYVFLNERYYAMRRSMRSNAPGAAPVRPGFSDESIRLFNATVLELRHRLDEIGAKGVIVHASKEIADRQSEFNGELPLVNAYPAFAAAKTAGRQPWYQDGFHYTAIGHEIIATELQRYLDARTGQK